jgi:hypothetical protein
MNKSTQITLDLEVNDDFLSGRIRDGSGAGRPFSGWLGLMAAIDELLAAAGAEDSRPLSARAREQGQER